MKIRFFENIGNINVSVVTYLTDIVYIKDIIDVTDIADVINFMIITDITDKDKNC